MSRLLILLIAAIGVAVATSPRRKQTFGNSPNAFPFPTRSSHDGIDLADSDSISRWCRTLGCDEEQLRAAVRHSGVSVESVRAHLARPR